jgi:hypothetical protein
VVKVCECCGHPLPSLEVTWDLTKQQSKILIEIERAGTKGVSIENLVKTLHAHDPQGGPDFALQSVRVQLSKMQHLLRPFDLRIKRMRNGNRRLEAL